MKFPFYRVESNTQERGYHDNTRSKCFDTESDAICYASGLKRQFRKVVKVTGKTKAGYGQEKWEQSIIAKWSLKKINGTQMIARTWMAHPM